MVVALVSLLITAFVPSGRTDTSTLQLVRVGVESEAQAAYLMSHFDETHNHAADTIELLLWPGDLAELDVLGLDYEVVTQDISTYAPAQPLPAPAPIAFPGPDRTEYRRLTEYNDELKALADENPSLVKLFEMKRPSLEGRTIYGIEIAANVKKEDGRPIFYMDAVHHAREWPASEYTMLYAHYLVEKFGKDPKITSLLKKARAIIVPIQNVDGFDYSRESLLSVTQQVRDNTDLTGTANGFEGYWRKNRRSLTGVTIPAAQKNPDAYGVDTNRNYSYLWGDSQGGSSGSQIDQTYRGAAPFSEPENLNVQDIVLGRSVTGIITNHTFQASVLRAGGGDAPEDDILVKVGQDMADILGYNNAPSVGYPTTGTTDDWAYAVMGAIGFTIEHGSINFHPPYADEVGSFWKEHMKAFDVMLEASADPKYHSVLKGTVAGGKAQLSLTKTVKTELSPGNPTGESTFEEKINMKLTTDNDGSFEWHVTPSTRPWSKKAESYTLTIKSGSKTKKIQVFVDRGEVLNLGKIKL